MEFFSPHTKMAILPDELWSRILEFGIESSKFTFKDLCCFSISCRRFNRLSKDDSLWWSLLIVDFPQEREISYFPNPPKVMSKFLYKMRFEREKRLKVAAHRRAVLRVESDVAVKTKTLQKLQLMYAKEVEKMKATMAELASLEKARQSSVAMKVWQPEVIRSRQKQIVEQCVVPVEQRVRALEMELRVCKTQITVSILACKEQKQELVDSKEKLAYLKYQPMRDYQMESGRCDSKKHKKLKLKNELTEYALKREEKQEQGSPNKGWAVSISPQMSNAYQS